MLTIQDQLETGRPSPSNTITPSTSSTGYIVSSPPNPLKSPLTRPTALERFLEPSNFTELFPSIRPHLIKGDLKRLAQVPGVFNRVATITLYQESVVELASESPSCLGQQFYFLIYGLNRPSPVGRISKKEALSFVKSMDLFVSSPAQALALLDIPFPRLQKVIIWARYLREILLQSHAETATITSETPYTDFHNPNKPFDFPEARLITHLASYATVVEIFVPGTSHYDEGEDEWHEHRSEVGYYLDESKLEPKELESGIWSSYLAIVPYQKRFPPGTVMDDWWNVPDLGDRLSLNRIKPIDTLVLWIHDASNTFHQLPSKNLIIALGPRVLRDEAGCLRCIDELPELAVIRYLLDSRAVTSSKVIIQIHPPPYIAIMSCNTLSPSILICWWIQTSWPDETPPLQT